MRLHRVGLASQAEEEILNVKKGNSLNHVQLFVSPWTVACQAPPSVGFSRQEYWIGLPFSSPKLVVAQIYKIPVGFLSVL